MELNNTFLEFDFGLEENLLSALNSSKFDSIFNFSISDAYKVVRENSRGSYLGSVAQGVLITVYAALIGVGLVGNFMVAFVIARKPQLRTTRNLYIINLTISDVSMCLVCMPFTLVGLLEKNWALGNIICKLIPALQCTNILVSTATILAIATDRYMTIVLGNHGFGARANVLCSVIFIWIASLGFTFPLFFFYYVERVTLKDIFLYDRCMDNWPTPIVKALWTLCLLLIQYVIPILVLTFVHFRIKNFLKQNMASQRDPRRIQREMERNRRTTTLLTSVALSFAVSWLPWHVVNLLADFHYSGFKDPAYFYGLFGACHAVAMSTACSNPILYGWLNTNLKTELSTVVSWSWNKNRFKFWSCGQGRTQTRPKPLANTTMSVALTRISPEGNSSHEGMETAVVPATAEGNRFPGNQADGKSENKMDTHLSAPFMGERGRGVGGGEVRVEVGAEVGEGVGAGEGVGVAVGARVGEGVGAGVGERVGAGAGVGKGIGAGAGTGVETGARVGVGDEAGVVVGVGVGGEGVEEGVSCLGGRGPYSLTQGVKDQGVSDDVISKNDVNHDVIKNDDVIGHVTEVSDEVGHLMEVKKVIDNEIEVTDKTGHDIKVNDKFCHEIGHDIIKDMTDHDVNVSDMTGHIIDVSDITDHEVKVSDLTGHEIAVSDMTDDEVKVNDTTGHIMQVSDMTDHKIEVSDMTGHEIAVSDMTNNEIKVSDLTGHIIEVSDTTSHDIEVNEKSGHAMEVKDMTCDPSEVTGTI